MAKHSRTDLYRVERDKGKTYREIAEMYCITYQAVTIACAKAQDSKFRAWTKDRCIYPNLRNWLNENRVSMKEFKRRMDNFPVGNAEGVLRAYFRGEAYPQKKTIDKMLEVTGLTYEKFWEVDDG
jgi:hypothetical protein